MNLEERIALCEHRLARLAGVPGKEKEIEMLEAVRARLKKMQEKENHR